jgi:hypothetical protein
MATRCYFDSQAPTVTPAFDAAWEVTGSAVRRGLVTAKDTSHSLETLSAATALNSPAGAVDVAIIQAVSAPLASGVTIAGAIAGQIRAQESNAAGDLRMQCVIWVMQSDGSNRGTLIAASAAALASEWATTLTNRSVPLGGSTTPTSVAAQTGDRIVVELGYRKHESATSSRTGSFSSGNPSGTDLAIDETTTTANVPWVEFTESLSFATPDTRVSDLVVQAAITPPTPDTRVSGLVVQAAIIPPTPDTRVSGLVVQAAIAPTPDTRVSGLVVQAAILLADAAISRSGSLTADAVIRGEQSGSFTADAVIVLPSPGGSLTADAVIRGEQSGSFTANAVRRTERTGSLTANAAARAHQSGSFTADAVLAITYYLPANAVVRRTQAASFTASAWIYVPRADPGGPGEPGETPLISIKVDDVDITRYVLIEDAMFSMQVNGTPGQFRFRVRDDAHEMVFVSGSEVTVDIDGKRKFGGYLTTPKRGFAFPVQNTATPGSVSRFLTLEGVDYNILFRKRVVRDKDDPADVALRSWPKGSRDDVVIRYVFDHYTDLAADGATYDGVTHVGSPNPDKQGVVASGGLYFGDAMAEINRLINGVYYFDAYKDLHFVDVDTANAPVGLSDNPGVGQIGYRNFLHVEDGSRMANDALVWGAGLGSKNIVFARSQSASSIAAHERWQYGEFTTQLFRQASVDARADSVVGGTEQSKRGGKDDQQSWRVETFDWRFSVGQKVTIESEVFGISDVAPIRRLTLTFPRRHPQLELLISHEIDIPWNQFEQQFPDITVPDVVIEPPPGLPDLPDEDTTYPTRAFFNWSRQTADPSTNFDDWFTNDLFEYVFRVPGITGRFDFDLFERTLSNSWGRSTDNHLWTNRSNMGYPVSVLGGGGEISVGSGSGTMDLYPSGTGGGMSLYLDTNPNGPWSYPTWDLDWSWGSHWNEVADPDDRRYALGLGVFDTQGSWVWAILIEWDGHGNGTVTVTDPVTGDSSTPVVINNDGEPNEGSIQYRGDGTWLVVVNGSSLASGDCICGKTDTFSRTTTPFDGSYDTGNNWGVANAGLQWLGSAVYTWVDGARGVIGISPDEFGGPVWNQQQYVDGLNSEEGTNILFSLQASRALAGVDESEELSVLGEYLEVWLDDDVGVRIVGAGDIRIDQWFGSTLDSAALPVDLTQLCWVRVMYVSGELIVKIWEDGDTEPEAATVSATTAFLMTSFGFYAGTDRGSIASQLRFYVDDLAIEGYDECLQRSDQFDRTLSASTSRASLGASALGQWVRYPQPIDTVVGPMSVGVNGSEASFAYAAGTTPAPGRVTYFRSFLELSVFPIDVYWDVRISSFTNNHISALFIPTGAEDPEEPSPQMILEVAAIPTVSSVAMSLGLNILDGSGPPGYEIGDGSSTDVSRSFAVDSPYRVRASIESSLMRMKCWPLTSLEPETWDLVFTVDDPILSLYQGLVTAGGNLWVEAWAHLSGATYLQRINVDGGCANPYDWDGTPDQDPGRGTATGDGVTTGVDLRRAYHPGTLSVYVDGYLQRPGIEYTETDPDLGTITFTDPPADGALIEIFYETNGRPL